MHTIDLNRIRLFARVVEAGSFTAAARAAGLPKSSVSRAIAALERDLAVRLIQRTTRRLQPTEDRKSTRLNSSHSSISYAVFCLKKKNKWKKRSPKYGKNPSNNKT